MTSIPSGSLPHTVSPSPAAVRDSTCMRELSEPIETPLGRPMSCRTASNPSHDSSWYIPHVLDGVLGIAQKPYTCSSHRVTIAQSGCELGCLLGERDITVAGSFCLPVAFFPFLRSPRRWGAPCNVMSIKSVFLCTSQELLFSRASWLCMLVLRPPWFRSKDKAILTSCRIF